VRQPRILPVRPGTLWVPSTWHQYVAEHRLLVPIDIDRKGQEIAEAIGVPEPGGPLGQQRGEGVRGGGARQQRHETLDRAVPVGAGAAGQEREQLAGIRAQGPRAGQARHDTPEYGEQQRPQRGRPQPGQARRGRGQQRGQRGLQRRDEAGLVGGGQQQAPADEDEAG